MTDLQKLYTYRPAVAQIERRGPELFERLHMSTAERTRLAEDFRGLEESTGLRDDVVLRLADRHIDSLLQGAQPRTAAETEARQVAQQQRLAEAAAEVRSQVRRHYGDQDAEGLLARVEKFAKAHPDLHELLQDPVVQGDQELMAGLVAHVFSSGYR